MSWDTVVSRGGFDRIVEVLHSAGVQAGEPEVIGLIDVDQYSTPAELKKVEFKHAVTGDVLVLEEYLKAHHIWETGDGASYIYDVHVRAPGDPMPQVEERNHIVEDVILRGLDPDGSDGI